MKVNDLVKRCYDQAKTLGWAKDGEIVPIPEMIALIHSEASEALESYRNHEPLSWTDEHGKPQGLASEFADIIVRIGHYSWSLGIDLEEELDRKLKYNLTRGHRHGGKAC